MTKDGSSFELAVIVNSVEEEYEYVRNYCRGCAFKSQALLFKGKHPYDALYLAKDGQEVVYYFDIKNFYGKGF